MELDFLSSIIKGDNNPPDGKIVFDSSDHVRFQNGQNVSGHNYNCHRRITIEKNIEGGEGYTVTMYKMDGVHPFWQNNIQMAPKRMKIVSVSDNIVELRGYGYDENALAIGAPLEAASYANYGVVLLLKNNKIERIQLNMFERNICIIYLQ